MEQRGTSVKYNCRIYIQDRHLHILTEYLFGRFYDSKNIETQQQPHRHITMEALTDEQQKNR